VGASTPTLPPTPRPLPNPNTWPAPGERRRTPPPLIFCRLRRPRAKAHRIARNQARLIGFNRNTKEAGLTVCLFLCSLSVLSLSGYECGWVPFRLLCRGSWSVFVVVPGEQGCHGQRSDRVVCCARHPFGRHALLVAGRRWGMGQVVKFEFHQCR